jgi:hypothetical protein
MTTIANDQNDSPPKLDLDLKDPFLCEESHVGAEASDKAIEEARRKLRNGDDAADSIQLERQLERAKHRTA